MASYLFDLSGRTALVTGSSKGIGFAWAGAVKMLTKGMAVDLGRHGIPVNGLGPGYFKTELTQALVRDETFTAWLSKRTPAGRWGEVHELAGAVTFWPATRQVSSMDTSWIASGLCCPKAPPVRKCGGFEVAAASHPQITTVAVHCFGIGRTSGELLLRAIEAARTGQALAPQTILIPYRVEARGST